MMGARKKGGFLRKETSKVAGSQKSRRIFEKDLKV